MAKASDNPFPSILLVEQSSAPAAPAVGQVRLYRGTDDKLYLVDEAGTSTEVGSGASAAWQDYTPALTATTTNPTLGTGATATGRYVQNGKTVHGWAVIVFGTGMTAGSGAYEITLPVAMRAASVGTPAKHGVIGSAKLADTGTAGYEGAAYPPDGGSNKVRVHINGSQVLHNYPFTWANTDRIYIEFTYEAA